MATATDEHDQFATLATQVASAERRGVARALRLCDDLPRAEAAQLTASCVAAAMARGNTIGSAVVGITGNPGAGKSTFVDRLIGLGRGRGDRVAVLAVDPTSPLTGGALLGDRVRFSDYSGDDGVYCRSLASRGSLGGLSAAIDDSIAILRAAAFELIILETVGVGQAAMDVAICVDTVVLLVPPGLGDTVQALKAGLIEVADVVVVTKADRPLAVRLQRELREAVIRPAGTGNWQPPVLMVSALRDEGTGEVWQAIFEHRSWLDSPTGHVQRQRRQVALFERRLDLALLARANQLVAPARAAALDALNTGDEPAALLADVVSGLEAKPE